ncbi:MAG: UDP-N-acetylmuramate dehydrogenase [Clostridiales bacterium]|nr:UDP-N-acetylmuramate dehydrogenase [Clostridiales bacterium]
MGFLEELYITTDKVKVNLSLKNFTAIGVGGKADYFVSPTSVKELRDIVLICKEYKKEFFVLGGGSNLLVSDKGFRGVIISTNNLNEITFLDDSLVVGAGVKVGRLINLLKEKNFSSLEFLVGVPLTVGGAVVSNAGAFNKSVSEFVKRVTLLRKGKLLTFDNKDCNFSYRKSNFLRKNDIITSVELKLFSKDKEKIEEEIKRNLEFRRKFQPLMKTFGSTFINGKDYFAGELIEKAGLKGYTVGGARVSFVHANFIENYCNATASDIYTLIKKIQRTVFERFKVFLELEVVLVGEFDDFNG